jgi:hypothetical protein
MLPLTAGFREEEWPSGVVRRGPPAANYRHVLAGWFGGEAPARKALGTMDARPARIPFLIF